MKVLIAFLLVFPGMPVFLSAQPDVVSGSSGAIFDPVAKDSISYTVQFEGSEQYRNLGAEEFCGMTFPGIDAPWSGNTSEIVTVVYTFTKPLFSVDVMLGYVGMRNEKAREQFKFTTDTGDPSLEVDPGTCAKWEVAGNTTISPNVEGAFVAIVHVTSAIPFTVLKIISGDNSQNGGSCYALSKAGAKIAQMNSTPYVKKPE
jgi:hypothetical protein